MLSSLSPQQPVDDADVPRGLRTLLYPIVPGRWLSPSILRWIRRRTR